ncbi:hypothetical protein [Candidatus Oleimmundimicrobium sp.]|uniref:hypothetical protein n=1 Tax=Candidatus Oleimmundimicrobium sp. TaxID=3060597 RepID=UPI002722A2CF|nr:hypothetical protein [Candidatus Oleimmundimicrobium sp.]MDO8885284.1 hypothetical protein [Candidatus Oleimmundimicrobium sp.]
MFHRLRIVTEAAFYSLLIFRLLSNFLVSMFIPKNVFFYAGILLTHYTTVLFCGFWTGFYIKVDGWLYSMAAFGLFYVFRQIFNVYYPLPLSTSIKILMLVPLLALLLIGATYGEIAAEKRSEKNFTKKKTS